MGVRTFTRRWVRKNLFRARDFRFHFIHIPKNGGQSIRYALELQRDVSLSDHYHYRYVDIADRAGRHLSYFCVVRNPWSRTASRYHFGRQNAQQWPAEDPRRQYIQNATFAQYVREQPILPIPEHPGQPWMGPLSSWFDQLEWIRDERGAVVCDCLRLEHLEDDLDRYFGRTILERRRNVTQDRYDYRSMYTDELAEIVARKFQRDIDYFGFSFDGPATRNTIA